MGANIKIIKMESKDKSVLQNLFQLYIHDITAALPMDVNEHGLFEYNYIDLYFMGEPNRYAYLIYVDNKIAGFALIDDEFMSIDKTLEKKYDFSEMFILNAYKKNGLGAQVATQIFDMHKGNWEIRPVPRSEGAKKFWLRVVKDYTNDHFKENYPRPNRLAITFNNEN